jgi:hypothetical protein
MTLWFIEAESTVVVLEWPVEYLPGQLDYVNLLRPVIAPLGIEHSDFRVVVSDERQHHIVD